jgi:NAD+ synthase (glutamine-hydrolysing)
MHLIKIGAAVLNQTPLAWEHNRRNIELAIDAAREQGVTILCLPELCITGYGCEDAFLSPAVQATAQQVLGELVAKTRGIVTCFGLPLFFRSGLYDVACLCADGRIAGCAAKRFLAGDGIHYEPRWFRPWPAGARAEVELCGEVVPLGDLMFRCGGVGIGFEICEDAWVAERPGVSLVRRGVDVILNPSASHFAFGKHEIRKRFVLEGSRLFGTAYAYANLLGNEAGRAIYDGDALIAAAGELHAAATRFSFADRQLVTAVVDIDRCRMLRARASAIEPAHQAVDGGSVTVEFACPPAAPEPVPAVAADAHASKEEEFTRATALGLFDYLRKSRSQGFVVSLSGGADSAAVACLVSLLCDFALAELGAAGLRAKLAHCRGLERKEQARDFVAQLLTTVYQRTANSSEVTSNAARALAQALGAQHLELDVEPLVRGYVERVSGELGRELDWQRDDLALQNIQARVRAPAVWLIANVKNALLLATSNRSEAAVGYTTMDGDTAGGLSPIAGIDKTYLRAWLRWLEQQGPRGAAPIPALGAINAQAPTAELRPRQAKQTDEDDLMPYDVLDAMERAAIRDKQSPLEVFLRLRARWPQHGEAKLAEWVERFFRLWARNQWKRERYAPSFHLDDENLDPKTWCRFPILSGGFEREIAELRAFLKKA